nr:MAG TPA: hypothetical protein [Caudoviricetes sp.]
MTDEFVLGILILGGVDRDFKIINSEWFQKCKIHLFGFYEQDACRCFTKQLWQE